MIKSAFFIVALFQFLSYVNAGSYTFELPDGDSRCFYGMLREKERTTVEFQVISGGNFDVDVTFRDPFKNVVKSFQREQYDYFDLDVQVAGEHELCFSNEFSSVTHKVVYMNWEMESEREKDLSDDQQSPLTMMDSVVVAIHENLRKAASAQTKVRLQEASSRSFVEALNDRVTLGSIIHALVIVVVAVGQVYLLRSLFKEPTHHRIARATPMSTVHNVGY
uniref:GOLD domain-containing protein n=1 Tax=Mesocestoides corti TaxID=53468 RepID=A0A5K3FEE1_MESCO